MAPRGPRPILLLTLVLLAAGPALASRKPWVTLNKKFVWEHVDSFRMPADSLSDYCKEMMSRRWLKGTRQNTFIHAPKEKIAHVCSLGGIPVSTGLRKSILHFRVTTCFLRPRSNTYRGRRFFRSIVIGCWNRLPVLYVE